MKYDGDNSKYTNHKCIIYEDDKGEKLQQPFISNYDMMNSVERMYHDHFRYIGYGECLSVDVDGQTKTITGKGYFYVLKSKPYYRPDMDRRYDTTETKVSHWAKLKKLFGIK